MTSTDKQSIVSTETPRYFAVVPAAGIGSRMEAGIAKSYLKIGQQTIFSITLTNLLRVQCLERLVVVVSPDDQLWREEAIMQDPKILVAQGGAERHLSVLNGLVTLTPYARNDDWILVHDVARPCVQQQEIDRLIEALKRDPVGGILATPIRETLKRTDAQGNIVTTVPREHLWAALTPQMFRYHCLRQALEQSVVDQVPVTDESSAIERMGWNSQVVLGSADNIKVTYPEDLQRAKRLLSTLNLTNIQ